MDWLGSRLCLTAAVGKDGAILSESGWRNVGESGRKVSASHSGCGKQGVARSTAFGARIITRTRDEEMFKCSC